MCFFDLEKGKGEERDERRRRIPRKKTKPRERGEVPTTNGLASRCMQSRRWGTAWEEGGRGGEVMDAPPADSPLWEKWRMGLGNRWKAGEVVRGWIF